MRRKNKKKKTAGPVVRKSNVFVEARYRFGLHEQKILLLIANKVMTNEKEFIPYQVSWQEIMKASKNKLNTVAKIDKACEKLKSKTISIKTPTGTDNFGFLSGWKTYAGKYVEFRIDSSMREMLLNLLNVGNFSILKLDIALSLPSVHAIRMYELLNGQKFKNGPVTVVLDDLKHTLNIPRNSKTYSDFGSFKRNILERAKKNLAKYTNISFTYKTIKEGRKVVALVFTIRENKKYQTTIHGAIARTCVREGDPVEIAGKRYTVGPSGIIIEGHHHPIGQLNQWLKGKTLKLLGER